MTGRLAAGPGMVMKPGPLTEAINAAKRQVSTGSKVVYLSPPGAAL